MKMFNWFDISECFAQFKGVYDLQELFEITIDYSFAPWETNWLLPQCITEDNFEVNIALIEKKWAKHFVEGLVSSIRVGAFKDVSPYANSEWFSHVVENGKFDSHFLEGIRVLKNKFADEKWDSYDTISEQR
ncbi:hypothetical protein [Gimesia aquarii]|uniref:Uncharacterized protein n=1 Tax=Gimesia aquarii TaxID=2527964 RepID=A0A517VW15_9PLAN|nr:hypothetical protein [Gimesia aquarii]QDT97195.1 hypothetical protein V144x_26660 [Gimesia aquarii]